MSAARVLMTLAALCLGTATVAAAEDYPVRPIKMILPLSAGGVGDVVARVLAEKASATLGQAIVIENRPGASTQIGTQAAAAATPDGYTIFFATTNVVTVTKLQTRPMYNLQRDFVPVLGIGSIPMVLAVSAKSKVQTIDDLISLAKSKDGGALFASGGVGSLAHLASAALANQLKMPITHVPFKGNNESTQALMTNLVDFFFPATADVVEFVKADQIRLLAVIANKRLAAFPNVPTMTELGYPMINQKIWYAILVPTKTPPAAIARLADAFTQAMNNPAVQQRLAPYDYQFDILNGPDLGKFIEDEANRWGKVIADNNITLN